MNTSIDYSSSQTIRLSGDDDIDHRDLFENMLTGIVVLEVIYDASGKPVDHRLLRANAQFEVQTGLKREEEVGKTSEHLSFKWPDEIRQEYYLIAERGGTLHWERYNESLNAHYDIRVFSPKKGQFALMFYDISERKAMENMVRQERDKAQTIIDSLSDPVFIMDMECRFIEVNRAACEHLGYSREELLQLGPSGIDSPDSAAKVPEQIKILREEGRVIFETSHVHKDGTVIPVELNARIVNIADKPVVLSVARDMTKRKTAEIKLRTLSTAIEQSPVSVVITDLDANIEYVNPRFTEVTGYTAEEAIGQNPRILQSGLTPKEIHLELWGKLVNGQIWHGEMINKRKNGEIYWEDAHIAPVKDGTGVIKRYVATKVDISERKLMEEKVKHLAQHDPLTDLPNRSLFSDRLQQALSIAKRDRTHLALMYIDLDKFKPVNDEFGHQIGDLLLKEVAKRMLECIRESDTIARLGGDEFVVLLPVIEAEHDALLVAEKIRHVLNKPFVLHGKQLNISSSTGIVVYPEHGTNEMELTKNADVAMYHVKEGGRNAVMLFNAGMLK